MASPSRRLSAAALLTIAGPLAVAAVVRWRNVAEVALGGRDTNARGVVLLLAAIASPVVLSALLGPACFAVSRRRAAAIATGIVASSLLGAVLVVTFATVLCPSGEIAIVDSVGTASTGIVVYAAVCAASAASPRWLGRWWPLATALGGIAAAIGVALGPHVCSSGK